MEILNNIKKKINNDNVQFRKTYIEHEKINHIKNLPENAKLIKLNGNNRGFVIVSTEDFKNLNKYSWTENNHGYVITNINGRTIRMHRFIMNSPDDKVVDHINHIRIDNRRENLRILTPIQNNQNKRKNFFNTSSSKYKGVCFIKKKNKFTSCVIMNNKKTCLGEFENEIDAAEKYDMYIVHNKLNHISLNFPEKLEDYQNRKYNPPRIKKVEYNGVWIHGNKYRTTVVKNNIKIHVGCFKTAIEAAKKYDDYIIKNNIPNKDLNFPEDYPNYCKNSVIKTLCEEVDDKSVKLKILNNYDNKTVLIDKEDYERIKNYTCNIRGTNKDQKYIRVLINNKHISLHRLIMNVTDPKIWVDHINSDPFDNRKINLRISNKQKNPQNRTKMKNTSSKYIGVNLQKKYNNWVCYMDINSKRKCIGSFKTEEEAARKRDLYILINHPNEHYKLNFDWTLEDQDYWKNVFKL